MFIAVTITNVINNMNNKILLPGTLVKIADKMPPDMSNFAKGYMAIVVGDYDRLCDETYLKDVDTSEELEYKVYIMDLGTTMSWYDANLLTPIKCNIKDGLKILRKHKIFYPTL